MNWKKLFDVLPIPGIDTVMATAGGIERVVQIAKKVSNRNSPEGVEEFFQENPEKFLQFQKDIAETALKKLEIVTKDVQHARSSNLKGYLKDGIGITSMVAFITMLGVVAHSAVTGNDLQDTPLVMLVFGAVITGWNQLQSFYFGSADKS